MKRTRVKLADVAGTVTLLLLIAFLLVPMPYVSAAPGATQDVLGTMSDPGQDPTPVISIEGRETFPSEGELLFTTVGLRGSPDRPISAAEVIASWFSPSSTVAPTEVYFPPGSTADEVREQNLADMTSSQDLASVVALTELGIEVPAELTIVAAMSRPAMGLGQDDAIVRAEDVVEPGDKIESINGEEIVTHQQLLQLVETLTPDVPITMGVVREGDDVTVTFAPFANDDGSASDTDEGGKTETQTRLGVYLKPKYDLPIDIDINAHSVGGPSAGLMFSLGIIDQLTPEDLTSGHVIAGTGAVSILGEVEPIGGTDHKILGAARAGATWFLVPESNCADITRTPPRSIEVVSVATVAQAREALESIREGEFDDLPRCPAQ